MRPAKTTNRLAVVAAWLLLAGSALAQAPASPPLWLEPGADGQPRVHLYFFWSESCPHCQEARPFVTAIPVRRPWVELHSLEVSRQRDNARRFMALAEAIGQRAEAVPTLIFCGRMEVGWADAASSGPPLLAALDACRAAGATAPAKPQETPAGAANPPPAAACCCRVLLQTVFFNSMKGMIMKTSNLLLGALLGSLLALPASAQMGGGMGPRDGMSPRMDPGTRPCADCGPGQRRARAFTFNHDNTPGWALMSKEERTAHREKMLASKSVGECNAYLAEHHQEMAARAKEQGKTINPPRANACQRMQVRGMFK